MTREFGFNPKYAYIVSACKKYIPELNALLNSLDYVGNKYSVHVWEYGIPKDLLDKWASSFDYPVFIHEITEPEAREYGGEGEILCRKRYWYAGEVGKTYNAICVLDADMVFVRNPEQYFTIAEKTGFILGASKEQNKVYDHEHHTVGGKFIIEKGYYNRFDICNCPLFIDARIWEKALKRSWDIFTEGYPNTNFKAPDMDALSVCLIEAGSEDKTIIMAALMWLGTNEQHLKPYIRAIENRGLIQTESGIPIFSYHGQYYKANWRKCQLANRHYCAEHYLKTTENPDAMAAGAMNLLYGYFKKMCFEHKVTIPKLNYVHPELPYEE